MLQISENLFRFEDTCHVYVVCSGSEAVLVDFGSGGVLDELAAIGVGRVTDVLMTHHHRDQGQGLSRAVAAGARVWVPHAEQDLFAHVDEQWQARDIYANYHPRRFWLLEPVPIAGTLRDYEERFFGRNAFAVVPTPGHTPGSITLLTEIDGRRVGFSGDLINAPGRVWSMAATQWSYTGAEGVAASIASLLDLKERQPDLLLPSHDAPITRPGPAIDLLVARFWELLRARGHNLRLFNLREAPYASITPHLLRHKASLANSYVVLSESGKALYIDFGYDFMTGTASGHDRASRRPWLYTLPALKRQFGINKIDVAMPTHHHDDHVAGFNLLREVEGTRVWAAESFADVLERPSAYDLPCLWFDPIPVDRRLPVGLPVQWEEYEFTLHPLPGHTLFAVAISFEIDGKRVLAAGDQYRDAAGVDWNYVYQNRFQAGDYEASAALYRTLRPELILPGHWDPFFTTPEFFDRLGEQGAKIETWHRELLPPEIRGFGADGIGARLQPYFSVIAGGAPVSFEAEILNPFDRDSIAKARVVAPPGWTVEPDAFSVPLQPLASGRGSFRVTAPAGLRVRRARIGLDLMVDDKRFGQQAEALVTVE
jgi:glyoxylase-like metal-dependent hydrolase (beta-lactamase superfamily II)